MNHRTPTHIRLLTVLLLLIISGCVELAYKN